MTDALSARRKSLLWFKVYVSLGVAWWRIILFLKAGFKFFIFNSIQAAMEGIMVGIVGSDKCNAIVIFTLKFLLKYFCKPVIYDMLWIFPIK